MIVLVGFPALKVGVINVLYGMHSAMNLFVCKYQSSSWYCYIDLTIHERLSQSDCYVFGLDQVLGFARYLLQRPPSAASSYFIGSFNIYDALAVIRCFDCLERK